MFETMIKKGRNLKVNKDVYRWAIMCRGLCGKRE